MSRDVSSTTQEALYASQTSACFITLIKIAHTDLVSDILLCNNNETITSNGDDYLPAAFTFTMPADVDGKITNTNITLDAVDRSIIFAVRSISSPATLTISIIEVGDPNTIEVGPWDFELRNVSFTSTKVTGDLIQQNYTSDNISTIKYTNTDFPGIYAYTSI